MSEENEGNQEGTQEQVPPQNNATGGGEQPQSGGDQGSGQEQQQQVRTFTQEDLDRIIPKRAEQARRSLLKDLGIDDEDALKAIVNDYQKIKDAEKTELERAQERAERAETEAEEARLQAQDYLIRSAFMAEAARVGAANPGDAYLLADLTSITIGDDATVEGVSEAVKLLVDQGRLVMSGKPQPPKLDGGAGTGDRPTDRDAVKLTEAQLEYARKLGVSPEDYAKNISK